MSRIAELRNDRMRLHSQVVAIMNRREPQTAESRRQVADLFEKIDGLTGQIEAAEGRGRPNGARYPVRTSDPKEIRKTELFGKFLRKGEHAFTAEEMRELRTPPEKRDGLVEGDPISRLGTYTGLGFFVPTGFVYDVENALKYYAPLIDGKVVDVLETATGQPLPYPISNDTTQEAQIIGEAALVSEQDVTANHIKLGAYKYTSGLVKVSLELLEDSAFNLESWLADRFAIRFGRAYERDCTNGTGVGQPTGIITDVLASGAVPVVANGSAESSGGLETGVNSVGYTDLVRLEHSVDPAYRRGAKFMLRDTTLGKLKQILDKFGRPLWTPGVKDGAPDTLIGYEYVVNQHMPAIAASANTIVFGDLKKFVIRKVKGAMYVQRLVERYADFGQVAFLAFDRIDSRLIDSGTHPLSLLQQHS